MSPTRRPLVRALAFAAAAVIAPTTLLAQGPAPADGEPHVVRRGDTLWDLSARCLGDPFRWPELHKANLGVVENPHLIYPGELLSMPCEAVRAAVAAGAEPQPAPAIVGRVDVVGPQAAPASAPAPESGQPGLEARRALDYLSAPYAAAAEGPYGAGRVRPIVERVGSSSMARHRFQLADEVQVELPEGATPEPGTRFVAVRRSGELGSGVAVFVPTGVVELRQHEGALVRGRVVGLLGAMEAGDALVPMPRSTPEAASGEAGAGARVAWVQDGAILPSLQDWIVLVPAAGAQIVEGDVVELLHAVEGGSGAVVGSEVVATARVVRVTPQGATAMITSVRKPLVAVGTAARVTRISN